jgi:hypothetical protein
MSQHYIRITIISTIANVKHTLIAAYRAAECVSTRTLISVSFGVRVILGIHDILRRMLGRWTIGKFAKP